MFSVVIPAYNEGEVIAVTVFDILKVLKLNNMENAEIIVVDDGSTDRTAEMGVKSGAYTISHPHNIGYGRSLKDGIKVAKFDTIVITDADGTYPLEMIPVLYMEYEKGFDMVVGARQGANYDESFKKKMLRLMLKKLVEFTAGRKIPDINSGLRVFSRKQTLPFFTKLCDTFSFTTSLTLAYMMNGKFVEYIPIDYKKREGKTKVRLFRDSMRTLQFIIEAILFYNPIKIFIVFSSGLVIGGALCLLIAGIFSNPVFTVFGIGFMFLSVLMFGIGLVSVQLKHILGSNENRISG
ncbi:MAG: glycosyltransferase family 2 protein [Ignavibacteria bacterium]|jgi:glycosyltransferase involved in cell wall biosynthesis|nr:glycosyltransferase family 2 protein [Ignavibacteria bacterium]